MSFGFVPPAVGAAALFVSVATLPEGGNGRGLDCGVVAPERERPRSIRRWEFGQPPTLGRVIPEDLTPTTVA